MFVEKPSKAVLKLDGKLEFVEDFFRTHIGVYQYLKVQNVFGQILNHVCPHVLQKDRDYRSYLDFCIYLKIKDVVQFKCSNNLSWQ